MIKRLHLYILRSYMGPLVMTFLIALFVLLMQFLWKYIDELVGKGLEWSVIGELMGYAATNLVPMALPLSILLSSLMLFGNLGEHYELTAMKASGISLQRIMQPLVVLGVVVSIMAFLFSNYVLPITNFKMGALLHDIRQQRPELNIKEGIFNDDIEGYTVRVGHKHPTTKMLYDVQIYDHRPPNYGNYNVTLADSGQIFVTSDKRFLIFKLFNGKRYNEIRDKRNKEEKFPHRVDNFESQQVIIEMAGFKFNRTDESLFRQTYQMMSIDQLVFTEDSLERMLDKEFLLFANTLSTLNMFKNARRLDVKDTTAYANDTTASPATWIERTRYAITRKTYMPEGQPEALKMVNNYDSLFNISSVDGQLRITEWGSNFAKATQNYISDMNNKFERDDKTIRKYKIAWHQKFTLSIACLIFFFIGAPLGAIIRKGGFGLPVVISVLLFIFYYIISLTGLKFAREAMLSAFEGMWLSSLVLLPLGIFLTYKATTDSALFNVDSYLEKIKTLVKAKNK